LLGALSRRLWRRVRHENRESEQQRDHTDRAANAGQPRTAPRQSALLPFQDERENSNGNRPRQGGAEGDERSNAKSGNAGEE
jgi:hypothetical protein